MSNEHTTRLDTVCQAIEKIQQDLHEARTDIKLVRRHVVGESEPDRSLLWRVGALESQNRRQAWWMKALGGSFLTAAAAWAVSKITGQ